MKGKKCGMLFGKLYIHCVKVHRGKGEGEACGMLFGKLYIHCVKVHRGEGEEVWHAVWKVICLLCNCTHR